MDERYLSLAQACEILGKSERTLYRWIKSGKLRAYKPGRDYEIPESAIRELRERSEVYPKVQPPLFPQLEEVAGDQSFDVELWRQHCEALADLFENLAGQDVPPSRALGWWDVVPYVAGYVLSVVDVLLEGVQDGTITDDEDELIPLLRAAYRVAHFADEVWDRSVGALGEEIERASYEIEFWRTTAAHEIGIERERIAS